MRVAIYARYSTEHQREGSIEDQLRLCRELIARNGWRLAGCFSDSAVAGASMLRPGLQRLLEAVGIGSVDLVVADVSAERNLPRSAV